ncbi:hypothetical protein BH09BAC2_BH09BAC2_14420 [soil metagenome]
MKNLLLVIFFLSGMVLFVQMLQAQTVDEVINKYNDARGGKEKLKSIQSIYMEGLRQMMGNEVPVKMIKVNGKLSRTEFEMMGQSGFTIVTPEKGWSFIPMRSQATEEIPADRLKMMQGELDIAGPLVDYTAKGNKVELTGKDTVNGNTVYVVKLIPAAGNETFYYIDAKTNLVIKTKTMVPARGNAPAREVITEFSDYKSVDGIALPHTINIPGTGGMSGSMTFDVIKINAPVADALFKP